MDRDRRDAVLLAVEKVRVGQTATHLSLNSSRGLRERFRYLAQLEFLHLAARRYR